MRCLYDQHEDFLSGFSIIPKLLFILTTHYVRVLDFVASQRIDCLVGDSKHIGQRIERYYGRKSEIIYPPVNTENGYISDDLDDYYLSVGRLTTPKRVDLLIEACNLLQRRLVIVGMGREMQRLKRMSGKTIEFRGRVSDEERSSLYARCRAFLFAPNEDFGIVPVEAQAYGRPVIAYGRGGSLETVVESVTGIFFEEQTAQSLADAILRFEAIESSFDPHVIQRNAQRFGREVFQDAVSNLVGKLLSDKQSDFKKLRTYAS
jgi:glycosyltransferase involved in cell wall biosynthesis